MRLFGRSNKEQLQHKITALITFVGVVIVNTLATTLPINGKTTGGISDSYPNLFAPAGITFAIWGLIYLLLAVYVVYQFNRVRGKHSKVKEQQLQYINKYFVLSSLLNMLWIFTWHYEVLWLSVIIMLGLLFSLIKINVYLSSVAVNGTDRWAVKAPFSVYFGWITVATVANITTWLVSTGWDGFGLRIGVWTVAILLVTVMIALTTIYRQRDWVYGLVIVWALAGILLKHLSTSGWNGAYPSVIVTLSILLAVFISAVLFVAEKEYSRSR